MCACKSWLFELDWTPASWSTRYARRLTLLHRRRPVDAGRGRGKQRGVDDAAGVPFNLPCTCCGIIFAYRSRTFQLVVVDSWVHCKNRKTRHSYSGVCAFLLPTSFVHSKVFQTLFRHVFLFPCSSPDNPFLSLLPLHFTFPHIPILQFLLTWCIISRSPWFLQTKTSTHKSGKHSKKSRPKTSHRDARTPTSHHHGSSKTRLDESAGMISSSSVLMVIIPELCPVCELLNHLHPEDPYQVGGHF